MKSHSISVIGTGYVGLSTAIGFATKGFNVITSEHDKDKATKVNEGILPFYEPNLQELLKEAVKKEKLKCVLRSQDAVLDTDITFIATGTPSRHDGSIDLQQVKESAREIGEALKEKKTYHLIVVKSTVTPTTTEKKLKPIIEAESGKRCGPEFGLCMNPEFLREGSALHDMLHPDRIIIGEHDKNSGDVLEAVFRIFFAEGTPQIIRTTLSNAEFIKYASNAFLAAKISFVNTLATICEKIPDTDVTIVAQGMGLDKRIGPHFLNAGLGYGGSCFPKDVKALIALSKNLGYSPKLIESIEKVNRNQPYRAVELCEASLGNLKGRKVSILGLAFKPNTDDMREAVSIPIINKLLKKRALVIAYDPAAITNAKTIFGDTIEYASSATKCIKNTDCCILVTEWEEFEKLTPDDFVRNMHEPIVIDGRRIYRPEEFGKKLKFSAIGLGH